MPVFCIFSEEHFGNLSDVSEKEEEGEEESEEVIVTSRDKNLLLEELSSTVNLGEDLASTQADKERIFEASDAKGDGELTESEIRPWMKDADKPLRDEDNKVTAPADGKITKTEWDAETFKIPFVSQEKLAKLFPELKEGVPGEEPNIGDSHDDWGPSRHRRGRGRRGWQR